MRSSTLLAVFSLSVAPTFAFQAVHVVNAGANDALQNAIDAAASGDTILVHGGDYHHAWIQGKSLTIVAEPALGTRVGNILVQALPMGGRCVLNGIEVLPTALLGDAILVVDCAGSVRLQGIVAHAAGQSSTDALQLIRADDVACVASSFQAGSQAPAGGTYSFPVAVGIGVEQSRVALYECAVRGGNGQDDHFINPFFARSGAGVGGAGIACDASSTVFISRCDLRGGNGGRGMGLTCAHLPCGIPNSPGADGGAGISAAAGATVASVEGTTQGGSGGAGGPGGQCCPQTTWPAAADGVAGPAESGVVNHFPVAGTGLSAPDLVRAGQSLALAVTGTPGERVILGVALPTSFAFAPAYSGVFLIGSGARRGNLGIIPPSGVLNASIALGPLPPGAQASQRVLQILAQDSSGALRLGGVGFVTLLDPAF